ncbi:MAG: dTMP kinase [Gammaproteobacteria bacterium]
MKLGKFITIEGSEGAGKSTALKFIQAYFAKLTFDIVLTREPGGTPLAEEIRHVLLSPHHTEKMSSITELLLMFASRAQHIHQLIQPSLQAGKWVISDRFIDATYAYQGGGRQIDTQQIEALDHLTVKNYYPNLTLLLDISPELGLARTMQRGTQKDRIEQERIDFFERVRQGYLTRAEQDPKRIKIINAEQALVDVQADMKAVLDTFIAEQAS